MAGKAPKTSSASVDGQVQHFGDVHIFEAHLQGFAVEARPVADIAGHVHIRQELHLDAQLSLTLAGFAAPAVDVEREAPRLVAADLALGQFGEQVADLVEQAGVGAGVGARRAPDGRLVDVDDLVEVLQPFDAVVLARVGVRAVQARAPGPCRGSRPSGWICPSRKRR